jgi:hypothetical protein
VIGIEPGDKLVLIGDKSRDPYACAVFRWTRQPISCLVLQRLLNCSFTQ